MLNISFTLSIAIIDRSTFRVHSFILTPLRTQAGFALSIVLMVCILLFSLLLSVSIGVAGRNIHVLADAIFRPARLTDLGLLGINAGAGFFVALTAVLFPSLPSIGMMLSAFMGAALAVLLVYGLGTGKHKTGAVQLILAGSAVSALLTALSQGVSLTFGLSKSLSFWTAGSLSGITWQSLVLTIPWIFGAGFVSLLLSGRLSILALGEESAAGLGINIRAVRLLSTIVVLILAGASVSLVGGISFLGLIVPHIVRFLTGEDYRRLLPGSALLGAILLVLADAAARTVHAPFDTPVGALVSAIGVPVFLALTYRKKGAIL